jgi:hypothetical protein
MNLRFPLKSSPNFGQIDLREQLGYCIHNAFTRWWLLLSEICAAIAARHVLATHIN